MSVRVIYRDVHQSFHDCMLIKFEERERERGKETKINMFGKYVPHGIACKTKSLPTTNYSLGWCITTANKQN